MNLSAPFIRRPVATTLLTFGLMLLGAVALYLLPIAPLPYVDIPTIKVRATLPGASPETVAEVVTTPLERALGRIAGVTDIYSTSTLGKSKIVLQFDLDRDINGAARDVQAALNSAQGSLPSGMASNPSYRKVNPSDAPILILALTSDTMTSGQMYDMGSTVIAQKLSQLRGVGEVEIGGSAAPAVRIELNPKPLHNYGISLEDIKKSIAEFNSNLPRGVVENDNQQWQISANSQVNNAKEYLPLIIGYSTTGEMVHLTDVAKIVDSVEDNRQAGMANGKPAVLIIIRRESGANIIETVKRVNQLLPSLQSSLPASLDVNVMMERTSTIRASLNDAGHALIFSVILVIAVVLLFLRNIRAALVPMITVPISLLSTFTVMYLFDYTLDNLSLMALTIVVGFVVDDSIVVLENISRHVEQGMPAKKAAQTGVKEVATTVLSMTLVLVAVFIPFLFMGGYVGLFVREFAVTLSVAVLISLIISLTTAPMMCAQLLKPTALRRHGYIYQWSERGFLALQNGYQKSLTWALRHSFLTLLLLILTVFFNIYLYTTISKGFFPEQDTGQLSGEIEGDQTISFQQMQQKMSEFETVIRHDPAVENVVSYTGHDQRNIVSMYIMLKARSERKESASEIIRRLYKQTIKIPRAKLSLKPMQDIKTGGHRSRSSYEYTLQADDLALLNEWAPRIRQQLAKLPELVDIDTAGQNKALETLLIIDYKTAARLNVSATDIDRVLNNAFSQRKVTTIYQPLNQYHVVMTLAPEYTQSPTSLKHIYVSNSKGRQIPLSLLAHYEQRDSLISVNHYALLPSTSISFNRAKGVSLSEATQAIDHAIKELAVPTTIRGSYQGSARAFKDVLHQLPILLLAAFLTLYIVLGILYESLIHPLTILSTLPSAGVGALLALMFFHMDFNVIAMIGIFMLIGIVMKNAIMMIDFALEAKRKNKVSSHDAIFQASILRFRPILMTSLAALFAAIPLAIGQGDGAEMRQPLGVAIGGGLILSQLLTLYSTPVIFLYFDRLANWINSLRESKKQIDESPTFSEDV